MPNERQKQGRSRADSAGALAVDRIPPQSIEAEQSVLGAMLVDKEAVVVGEDLLRAEDFYKEANAVVFRAILNLAHQGKEVDILTTTEELRRMGRLDDVGGVLYVNELPEHCILPKSVRRHAEIVADKAKLRRLIDAANMIASEAYAGEDETLNIVDDAERRILEVAKDDRKGDFVSLGEAVQQELSDINVKYQNRTGITGLSSGYQKFDALTSGFQKGDFIIVAARPSMGKTAFVLNIAKNVALGGVLLAGNAAEPARAASALLDGAHRQPEAAHGAAVHAAGMGQSGQCSERAHGCAALYRRYVWHHCRGDPVEVAAPQGGKGTGPHHHRLSPAHAEPEQPRQ